MKTEKMDRCWCGYEYDQEIEIIVPETEIERFYVTEYAKFNLEEIYRCPLCGLGQVLKLEK